MNASCTDSHRVCAFRFPCFVFREITASFPIIPSARTVQGVEKGFSTPCKCKSAKAGLHLGYHFLVKWVYAALKMRLAEKYPWDRQGYRTEKGVFIEQCLKEELEEKT